MKRACSGEAIAPTDALAELVGSVKAVLKIPRIVFRYIKGTMGVKIGSIRLLTVSANTVYISRLRAATRPVTAEVASSSLVVPARSFLASTTYGCSLRLSAGESAYSGTTSRLRPWRSPPLSEVSKRGIPQWKRVGTSRPILSSRKSSRRTAPNS